MSAQIWIHGSYILLLWLSLIPMSYILNTSVEIARCIAKHPDDDKYVAKCKEQGFNWDTIMVWLTVILFLHNSIVTFFFFNCYLAEHGISLRRGYMPIRGTRI